MISRVSRHLAIEIAQNLGYQLGQLVKFFPKAFQARGIVIAEKIVRILPAKIDSFAYLTFHELAKQAYLTKSEPLLLSKNFNGMRISLDVAKPTQSLIFLRKVYEPHLSHYLKKNLAQGDVFIDIGAHIGFHGLLAAQLVGDAGKVLAFEANPQNFQVLKKNIVQNGFAHFNAFNVALSDRKAAGVLHVSPFNSDGGGSLEAMHLTGKYRDDQGRTWTKETIQKELPHIPFEHEITMVDFDSFISDRGLSDQKVRCGKMDVEGHELVVLKGMDQFLKSGRLREFVIEVSKHHREVFQWMVDRNYSPFTLGNDGEASPYLGSMAAPPTSDYLFRLRDSKAGF